ncbi:MAG: hypothetical protein COB38_09050 [Gammaproteobacteria bacterium]|nr:MAG: hypothetical protein COB38_09050 [Gammaproteobacteria bacterium]
MKNLITASIEFYFKGEKISASVDLDLNSIILSHQELPDFYPLLATSINLDIYSYEYEMMQAEEINFSSSNSLVEKEILQGKFDFPTYKKKRDALQLDEDIQNIIQRYFTNDELKNNSNIKTALIAASHLKNISDYP